MKGSKEG
jgi:hypothetical protein